jgi:hypothetical protein
MRNKRGQYESIDIAKPRGSSTAGATTRKPPVKQAEYRLRMIEQISKYREEKIKKEFLKLEEDLRLEDEKQRRQMIHEEKMR